MRSRKVNYESTFHSTGVVMAFTDDEGAILDVNQAWVKSFGIPREQAIGKTAAELGIWAKLIEREACLCCRRPKTEPQIEGMPTQN